LTYEDVKTFIESHGCGLNTKKENYINSKHKLDVKCKCGNDYPVSFEKFKHRNQRQCKECSGKKTWDYKQIKEYINNTKGCELQTNEEEYLIERGKGIVPTKVKLNIKCICTNIFTTDFISFNHKKKHQCNKCGKILNLINVRLSQKDFCKRVFDILGDKYNVIGNYIDVTTMIKMRHNCDECNNYEYEVLPSLILYNSQKCPECFGERNTEKFKREIYNLVGNEYILKSEYIDSSTHVLIEHNYNKCNNHTYLVLPNNFLKGHRCPKCSGCLKKDTEQFKEEVFNLIGEEYEVIGEYINAKEKIDMKHNLCNNVYPVTPDNFLRGRRCPICNESKGEQNIRYYLEYNMMYFIAQYPFEDLRDIELLLFDFIIFEDENKTIIKMIIEYDGEFHYKAIKLHKNEPIKYAEERLRKQQYHDKMKNEYCKNNNIPLLRIPYWEFDNIEEILKREIK